MSSWPLTFRVETHLHIACRRSYFPFFMHINT